jgi:hypothetical protein
MIKQLRASNRTLYFILLWCLCSFKVLLGGVGEAGLRVDDLLIVLAFAILAWRGDLRRVPRSKALNLYLLFIGINLCSTVWNSWTGRVDFIYAALFAVRLLEYLVFYYLGFVLMESGANFWRGFQTYFYALCVVVPLQTVGLIPVASRFNAVRASGNTNGPYELAIVAAFFLCFFGYQERKKLSATAAFALLVLTASRITFVGTAISFMMRTLLRNRSKLRTLALAAAFLLAAWGVSAWIQPHPGAEGNSESLNNRLNNSSSLLSVSDLSALWDVVPTYRTEGDYFQGAFIDAGEFAFVSGKDASGMIRVYRWAALLKTTVSSFDSVVIGLGPSFGSAAVDGYFVRVFIETGLIGLIAFLLFARALLLQRNGAHGAFREFVIILLVTACAIDVFTSYKAMLLLWTWHGMNEFTARQDDNAHSLPDAG